jgi:hypothetical protein
MPDFDVNEGYIAHRALRAGAPGRLDRLMLGQRARITPRHDRLPGLPS